MGPVDVWISTDSVSLIIIPFSDVVDGNALYMVRSGTRWLQLGEVIGKTIPDTIFLLSRRLRYPHFTASH